MRRRVPIVATVVVALAIATMVALGLWQMRRMDEKEAQLARYERAIRASSDVVWPAEPADYEGALYRRSRLDCRAVERVETVAGHSAKGDTGWANMARCRLPDGSSAEVALGWSRNPRAASWNGGTVAGFVGPYKEGVKLVAAPPLAGLDQLAAPDPRDVPNNHLSYAVQWFLFALTALVIYVLALRKRWRASAE